MTGAQQRAALQRQIWQIANDVRGAVDGWDFKQYVLGTLFYRFISENFSSYIEAGDDSIDYAALDDSVITPEIKDDAIKTKGYFKRYISTSLKREYASENGTELNAILPKMSPLNPQYLTKKQSVFQKIAAFVEKFKGVGGEV